jgi:SAM-dependent methyltransferase
MAQRVAHSPGSPARATAHTRGTPRAPRTERSASAEGWSGWDQYAPFYDWENAQTLGHRDLGFWRRLALRATGRVLELGCGTGRLSVPIAAAGVPLTGLDRSAEMLERAARREARRLGRAPSRGRRRGHQSHLDLVRGDMRFLPFDAAAFGMVFAPYGVLQSLVRDRDLSLALAEIDRVLAPGGIFGLDLVPDVPNWREYKDRVQLRGRLPGGARVTLIESVSQDRTRFLTTFDQRFVVSSAARASKAVGVATEHRFQLRFRTLPVARMTRRLERAGFTVEQVLGSYRGGAWDEASDVWLVLARKAR